MDKIPDKKWYHDPNLQNNINKSTVAMCLAQNCIIPPKEWEHNPELQDKYGYTTAMYIIEYCR